MVVYSFQRYNLHSRGHRVIQSSNLRLNRYNILGPRKDTRSETLIAAQKANNNICHSCAVQVHIFRFWYLRLPSDC